MKPLFALAIVLICATPAVTFAQTDYGEDPSQVGAVSTRTEKTEGQPLLGATYASECGQYPDVPVNVTPRFDEPVYDFNTPLDGIAALASDHHHSIHESITMGLTRYEPLLRFAIPVRQVSFSDGAGCARVEHVDVLFGYRNVTVLIAQQIPEGSCGFDQVMTHEQKHIAVNRAILEEYTPEIERRLKAFLRDNGMIRERNVDYATEVLQQKLKAILIETIDEIVEENRKRQQQVDAPEEYRRLTYSCNGQLAAVARHFQTGR